MYNRPARCTAGRPVHGYVTVHDLSTSRLHSRTARLCLVSSLAVLLICKEETPQGLCPEPGACQGPGMSPEPISCTTGQPGPYPDL